MTFKNKHVFFVSDVDIFFSLFADSLVFKCGLPENSIVAVVYKSGRKESLIKNSLFDYVYYDDELIVDLLEAKTLTFMSFLSWNSYIAERLIKCSYSVLDKLYIFITDDEVDRWDICFEKSGSITVSDKLKISDSDIFVLSVIKRFIGSESFFRPTIEKTLKRTDFELINANVIFDILNYHQNLNFTSIVPNKDFKKEKRILLGSKGAKLKTFFKFLRLVDKKNKNLQVIVFSLRFRKRLVIDIFLIFFRIFHKTKIDMIYLGKIPPLAYNAIVQSCGYIILQDRGGISTARSFLKYKSGSLIINSKSKNGVFFKEVFGVDYIDFDSGSSFCFDGFQDFIESNSKKIVKDESRSVSSLKEIYD